MEFQFIPAIRFLSIILEIMNNEGINNSTESSSGSIRENDHSHVQSGEVSGKGKKRHSCSISTKLEVIAYAESNSKEVAARKFRVDAKRIREWCQKKAELETSANPRKRLHGSGRKPLSTELEDRVLEWIHDMRARGQRVSRRSTSKKGEIIWHELKRSNGTDVTTCSDDNEEISQQDFKASNGWVVRFMKRHGLTCLNVPLIPVDYRLVVVEELVCLSDLESFTVGGIPPSRSYLGRQVKG